MMSRIYRPSGFDFEKWMAEPIWYSRNARCPRRECIAMFAADVEKWIQHFGYRLDSRWGLKPVALWLYAVNVVGRASDFPNKQRIRYPDPEHRDWQEDYDYFEYTITRTDIDKFLERWQYAEDFLPDTRWGEKAAQELSHLLYCHLDLVSSENGKKIARYLEASSSDSDEEPVRRKSRKEKEAETADSYLQDMKEGFHGGGVWSKV